MGIFIPSPSVCQGLPASDPVLLIRFLCTPNSLWPPDGAARAPQTCDYRLGLLVALRPDPFHPRNCNTTTSRLIAAFSKQTQGLGQECAPRPDRDFPRPMDTWCFAFLFLFQKKKKSPKTKLIKGGDRFSSQISESALLPNKRGERKGTGREVSSCREGKHVS